jgi:aspartate carbamoyltransferase catalytic subunit
MGAAVTVCGPPTMVPPGIERLGTQVSHDMDQAIGNADVVMMLRLQLERQTAGLFPGVREYAKLYGLNRSRLERAAKHVLVMHPGPINRGVEISSDVADHSSVILEQVTNGVAVRMAVMFLLSGGVKTDA